MGSVLRWMRALTLASVLVATGVAGHAAADGAVPAPLLLAVLFVGATLVLAPVLGSPSLSCAWPCWSSAASPSCMSACRCWRRTRRVVPVPGW